MITVLFIGLAIVIFCLVLAIGYLTKEVEGLKAGRALDVQTTSGVIRSVEALRKSIDHHQAALVALAARQANHSEKGIEA